ncbi:MAG: metallophosphoesterase [Planctomycetota bacterium]|nr:metallophosphoesterase [Planctomycetota bacterium]
MRFVFFTDVHLLEREDSVKGFELCIESMLSHGPEVLINGGDLGVPDGATQTYNEMIARIGLPVHMVNGNHEICNGSLDPERAGEFSNSFDHAGVHFVMLDLVRAFEPTEEHPWNWYFTADEKNLKWLEEDLAGLDADVPIILTSHVPLSTSFPQRMGQVPGMEFPVNEATNAKEVLEMLSRFRNVATLHGHDHENSRHRWRHIQILTTGAVAGNWWRNGLDSPNQFGEPQGYRVIDVDSRSGEITNRYHAFQPHQDIEIAPATREGRRFVNVIDGGSAAVVHVEGVGRLSALDPWGQENKRLSTHYYELPEECPPEMDVEVEFEDGRTVEASLLFEDSD